jgi:hypothetical protein
MRSSFDHTIIGTWNSGRSLGCPTLSSRQQRAESSGHGYDICGTYELKA